MRTASRTPRWPAYVASVVAALGLAASVALVFDYLGPEPAFCGDGGGCAEIRATAWARPLGVPLPVIGVGFFTAVLALSATRRTRALRVLVAGGAIGAAGLLAVQGLVLGTWCKLCVVTDTGALALAALTFLPRARRDEHGLALAHPYAPRRLVAALAAAAVALPVAFALTRPATTAAATATVAEALPDVVAREQRDGVVTIVDFVDFECPFCRRFHERVVAAIEAAGVPVRVVRKMVPLADIHAGAMAAALAWCCADDLGEGDEMAEALLAADPATLTPDGCASIAATVGLDPDAVRACMDAPAARARVEADLADARAAGVRNLPTVYIGGQRFVGARASEAQLADAIRTEAATLRAGSAG